MPVRFTPTSGSSTGSRPSTASARVPRPSTPRFETPPRRRPTSSHGSAASSLLKPPEPRPRSRSQDSERKPRTPAASSSPSASSQRLKTDQGPSRPRPSKTASRRGSVSPHVRSPESRSPKPEPAVWRRNSFDSDDEYRPRSTPQRRFSPSPSPSRAQSSRIPSKERQRPDMRRQISGNRPPWMRLGNEHPSPPFKSGGSTPLGTVPPSLGVMSPMQKASTPLKYKPKERDYFSAVDGAQGKKVSTPTQKMEAPVPQPVSKPVPAAPASTGNLFSKIPKSLVTFSGLQALNEHADTAKEWADWLNELRGAPEEMQSLSARAATARDTVNQIQNSIKARPDLLEGESGEKLKEQIEDAIESTNKVLQKMTKMLEDLSKNGAKEATVWSGLQEFYNSYRYKSEWEDKVKKADDDLQKELGVLSTLMVNIYSRSLMKPAPAAPTSTTMPPPAPSSPVAAKEAPQAMPATTARPQAEAPTIKLDRVETIRGEPLLSPKSAPFQYSETTKLGETSQKSAATQQRKPPRPDVAPRSPSTIAGEEASVGTAPDPGAATTPAMATTPATAAKAPPAGVPLDDKAKADAETHSPSEDKDAGEKKTKTKPSEESKEATAEEILLDAAYDGDIDGVAKALCHASPNACDTQGFTPLHLSAQQDHLAITILLLDRGAKADALANGRRTPLHLASRFASADTVELLLERGNADPNAPTADGRTPLHYAASASARSGDGDEDRRDVIRVLRDWGADPTVEDRKRRTPRDYAQKRDSWDVASTLRRAEKKWEEEHRQNWLQRHGFMK